MPNFRQGTELQSIHVTDTDPTVGPGIPGGTPNMLLLRTDNNSIYYFAGPLDTDWRLAGTSSSGPSFPDIIDTPATRVQIGDADANNAGCKTVIGEPYGPPHPLDLQLLVRSNVGASGAASFEIADIGLGALFRVRCDPNNGGIVAESNAGFRGSVYGYGTIAGIGGSGVQNNVQLDSGYIQMQPSGPLTITGVFLPAPLLNLNANHVVEFFNFGASNVTLTHEDALSTDINRWRLKAATQVIPPNGGFRAMRTVYPGVGIRWIVIAVNN